MKYTTMSRRLRYVFSSCVIPVVLIAGLAFLLPAGLTMYFSTPETNNIIWNRIAVFTDGTNVNHDIVEYDEFQQCNPNCVGACTMCVMSYTTMLMLTWLT